MSQDVFLFEKLKHVDNRDAQIIPMSFASVQGCDSVYCPPLTGTITVLRHQTFHLCLTLPPENAFLGPSLVGEVSRKFLLRFLYCLFSEESYHLNFSTGSKLRVSQNQSGR